MTRSDDCSVRPNRGKEKYLVGNNNYDSQGVIVQGHIKANFTALHPVATWQDS